jgi:arylformamidase
MDRLTTVDTRSGAGYDISIPLRFNGVQPNAYGVSTAASTACEAGDLVGDTRRGGSCNFEQYTFIPHCNGTHTECVGHITHDRISVLDCLQDVFIRALLVSVEPERAADSSESYSVPFESDDLLITKRSLENSAASGSADGQALVIRTLPNDESKKGRSYGEDMIPPYFTSEAIQFIVQNGFSHLLVDVPSIDRLFDEGKLSNHRTFWNVESGSNAVKSDSRITSTVTELIYVPHHVTDGKYWLNLQIAPFAADATPSRPILFPVDVDLRPEGRTI